jgi:hypothetical protein
VKCRDRVREIEIVIERERDVINERESERERET